MHTRERRSALLAALKEKKKVTVAELASAFDVTTMTIRRDLKRLADENIVTLVHGGAIYNEGGTALASVGVRACSISRAKVSSAGTAPVSFRKEMPSTLTPALPA